MNSMDKRTDKEQPPLDDVKDGLVPPFIARTAWARGIARTGFLCIEGVAVILFFMIWALGLFIWMLTRGPMDVSFAKDYIQDALRDPVSGYEVELTQIGIEWPDLSGPFLLDVQELKLLKDGGEVLSVKGVDIGLSMQSLFAGQIKPISVSLSAPSLHLIRSVENDVEIAFMGQNKLAVPAAAPQQGIEGETAAPREKSPLMQLLSVLSKPPGSVDPLSPFDHLQSVEITDARMVMEDHVLGMTWYLPGLNMAFARVKDGLAANAGVTLPGGRDGAALLETNFVYNTENEQIELEVHVQDFDPKILSRQLDFMSWFDDQHLYLNGDMRLHMTGEFDILGVDFALFSSNGELMLDGVYDDPFAFERLNFESSYDAASNIFDLKSFKLAVNEVEVELSSKARLSENFDEVAASVHVAVPSLPQEKISGLWPDVLRGEGAEVWLTKKWAKGSIDQALISLNIGAAKNENQEWSADISDLEADFKVKNTTIHYRDPLDPVEQMEATGRYADDKLSFDVTSATLSDIDVTSGSVVIDNVSSAADGIARVNMMLDGPLNSVFKYIAKEPIDLNEDELGIAAANVEGRAALNVNVTFPTIRNLLAEQVAVKIDGTMQDVVLPDVVKGMALTGGPLTLAVSDGAAKIEGKGALDGRAVTFSWLQYLSAEGKGFASQLKAQLAADPDLREKFGVSLDDWMEGVIPVHLTYTEFADNTKILNVVGDLQPAIVKFPPLSYEKPVGIPGSVQCDVHFVGSTVKEITKLNLQVVPTDTPVMNIQNGGLYFEQVAGEAFLRYGKFPVFQLEDNDLSIEFERPDASSVKIVANGKSFDARSFLKKDKSSSGEKHHSGPAVIASLTADQMRTKTNGTVSNAKLYLDMARDGLVQQFEMDAHAGSGDIYLRFKPNQDGVMSIRLEADDAGATLNAFDLYENVRGGKITLYGEAVSPAEPYILHGNMEMSGFHVVNAPTLAHLINAISLLGLGQVLSGEGLYFSRMQAGFDWFIRPQGDLYVIKDGKTSGSSLGLTFAGSADKAAQRIDLNGTIIPASMINDIVTSIPVIGDILSGGSSGGVFAATYTMKGPMTAPEISVNPLSVLTPGIFRRIFFEEE
jgi:hypothetical protein